MGHECHSPDLFLRVFFSVILFLPSSIRGVRQTQARRLADDPTPADQAIQSSSHTPPSSTCCCISIVSPRSKLLLLCSRAFTVVCLSSLLALVRICLSTLPLSSPGLQLARLSPTLAGLVALVSVLCPAQQLLRLWSRRFEGW